MQLLDRSHDFGRTVQYEITGDSSNPISTPEKALQYALEKDARLVIQKTLTEITGDTIEYSKCTLPSTITLTDCLFTL